MKFKGDPTDLKQALAGAGYKVRTVEGDNRVEFRVDGGGIVAWTRSTGTVTVQGKESEKEKLETVIHNFLEKRAKKEAKQAGGVGLTPTRRKPKRKIFIVHGHDLRARDELELILHELGLKPFVLARSDSEGLTIIEALERHILPGSSNSSGFGIVLLTPDDVGYAKKAGGVTSKPRARQNVVLELGMLVGALGRKNVAVLKTGNLELPSDIDGVLYLGFDLHVREIVPRLVQRMRGAGFEFTSDHVAKAAVR